MEIVVSDTSFASCGLECKIAALFVFPTKAYNKAVKFFFESCGLLPDFFFLCLTIFSVPPPKWKRANIFVCWFYCLSSDGRQQFHLVGCPSKCMQLDHRIENSHHCSRAGWTKELSVLGVLGVPFLVIVFRDEREDLASLCCLNCSLCNIIGLYSWVWFRIWNASLMKT